MVAAFARGDLSFRLERLPECPVASALLEELKAMVMEVMASRMEDAVSISCAALAAGEDPGRRWVGNAAGNGG